MPAVSVNPSSTPKHSCYVYVNKYTLTIMLYCDSRVERLLRGGGEMVLGGDTDRDDLYIAPTILIDVANDDAVMQEEVICV